jgi:hypothetical protein
VGDIAFVREMRYVSALNGGSEPTRFVQGAREANVAEYIQSVGGQMVLPYAHDAQMLKQKADIWAYTSAVEQNRLAAEEQAQAVAAASAPAYPPASRPVWHAPAMAGGTVMPATITFYACIGNGFCGNMASGHQVFDGAAACSTNLPFGTRFMVNGDPTGRIFTCLDRGALSTTWVDIWFYDVADGYAWQSMVGTSGTITILN